MKSTITTNPPAILEYLKANWDFRKKFPALMGNTDTEHIIKHISYRFLPQDEAVKRLEKSCSLQALKEVQKEFGDVTVAMNLNNRASEYNNNIRGYHDTWDNRIALDEYSNEIYNLIECFCNSTVICTGHFWYPKNSWCAWHTNNDSLCPGERLYLIWAAESDKSFFRYIEPMSGNVITQWERAGWQLNQFNLSGPEPLWHCIGSYTDRIAIGLGIPHE